jgi:lactoylglutathione lyase
MVKKLLHTRYRVHDLEKTISFYKDVLGLQEVRRHTSGRGSQLVFLKAPGSDEEIEICKGHPLSDGPHSTNGGRIAFVDAPEGYEVELIERGKK